MGNDMFGAYLTKARIKSGKSQAAVARLARVHTSSMCDMEKGRRRPTHAVAKRLAKALGLDLADVLARAGLLTPAARVLLESSPTLVARLNRQAEQRAA